MNKLSNLEIDQKINELITRISQIEARLASELPEDYRDFSIKLLESYNRIKTYWENYKANNI